MRTTETTSEPTHPASPAQERESAADSPVLTASAVGVVAAGVAGAAGHNTILPERGSRKLAVVVGVVALGALIYDLVRHRRAASWSDKVRRPSTTSVDHER